MRRSTAARKTRLVVPASRLSWSPVEAVEHAQAARLPEAHRADQRTSVVQRQKARLLEVRLDCIYPWAIPASLKTNPTS